MRGATKHKGKKNKKQDTLRWLEVNNGRVATTAHSVSSNNLIVFFNGPLLDVAAPVSGMRWSVTAEGKKKRWSLPREEQGEEGKGLPEDPPSPSPRPPSRTGQTGAFRGGGRDVCQHWTGNVVFRGGGGGGGLASGPCKRRCLRCERGVVHPGKSLSRASLANQFRCNLCEFGATSSLQFFYSLSFLIGCSRRQETPEADTARGQAVRWSAWGGALIFVGEGRGLGWGGGAVWLTLKVPLSHLAHTESLASHSCKVHSSSKGGGGGRGVGRGQESDKYNKKKRKEKGDRAIGIM